MDMLLGKREFSQMDASFGPEGTIDGTYNSCWSRNSPTLSRAFGLKWIEGSGRRDMFDHHRSRLHRCGEEVIHEGAGNQLPISIVKKLFIESAAHTCCYATVHLTFHDEGINRVPTVVHYDVLADPHLTCAGIYFYLYRVHPTGVCRLLGPEERRHLQSHLIHAVRQGRTGEGTTALNG